MLWVVKLGVFSKIWICAELILNNLKEDMFGRGAYCSSELGVEYVQGVLLPANFQCTPINFIDLLPLVNNFIY